MRTTFGHRSSARHDAVMRMGLAILALVVAACGSSPTTGTPAASAAGSTSAAATPEATGAGTPAATGAGTPGAGGTAGRPWLDTTRTVDERVAALLAQMTLDEKIGQMTQIENEQRRPGDAASALLGSVLSRRRRQSRGADNTAQGWYDMVDRYQHAALGTRLGIPILYGADMRPRRRAPDRHDHLPAQRRPGSAPTIRPSSSRSARSPPPK